MSLPTHARRRHGETEGALTVISPHQPCAPQGQPWPWLRSGRLLPRGIYDSLAGAGLLLQKLNKASRSGGHGPGFPAVSSGVHQATDNRGRGLPSRPGLQGNVCGQAVWGYGPVTPLRWASVSSAGLEGVWACRLADSMKVGEMSVSPSAGHQELSWCTRGCKPLFPTTCGVGQGSTCPGCGIEGNTKPTTVSKTSNT